MPDHDKIRILLADEDALRRDGLAAVLGTTARFEIVAQCPDGEAALAAIESFRPDVAVIDLNLPRIHGIELVRRVRAGGSGTRVVILSGSTDDDIIREVVRAGGDGYLLKNGPARHLVDAISYVCDGGQYFSPQLRRDGLDRHLLREQPRQEQVPPPPRQSRAAREPEGDYEPREDDESREDYDAREDYDNRERNSGPGGSRRSTAGHRSRPQSSGRVLRSRRDQRRTADPEGFRERIREEDPDLEDRDYEILSVMAEGIRPILDRLDDIEGRVIGMETGAEPVPRDVRGWLNSEMADTFVSPPGGRQEVALGRTVQDLERRLPQLIEDAVTSRFNQMAGRLQEEIEETHIRTLETFVKNIQVKLVQRVAALETDMTKQAEAMQQLRDSTQRTEDNLGRLISGVDRLAQELPRRLAEGGMATAALPEPEEEVRVRRRARSSRQSPVWPKVVWATVGLILLVAIVATVTSRMTRKPSAPQSVAPGPQAEETTANRPPDLSNSDTRAKLQAAQEYADRKDYSTAEDIYRQVLKAEPNNADAIRALASVLYREDKIEESASMLEKLPKN